MLLQASISEFPDDNKGARNKTTTYKNEDFQCLVPMAATSLSTRIYNSKNTRRIAYSDDSEVFRDKLTTGKQKSKQSTGAISTMFDGRSKIISNMIRDSKTIEENNSTEPSLQESIITGKEKTGHSPITMKKNKVITSHENKDHSGEYIGNIWKRYEPIGEVYAHGKGESGSRVGLSQKAESRVRTQRLCNLEEYEVCKRGLTEFDASERQDQIPRSTSMETNGAFGLSNTSNEPYSPSRFYCEREDEMPNKNYSTTQMESEKKTDT